jgi:hypothetical protein
MGELEIGCSFLNSGESGLRSSAFVEHGCGLSKLRWSSLDADKD